MSDETDGENFYVGQGGRRRVLVIACGALAREILSLRRGPVGAFDIVCLPAMLHNWPQKIPDAMRSKIRAKRADYDEILCLYGDCGTGGQLDQVLAEEGVTRIEGPHCYSFYAGAANYEAMIEQDLGTFFLTDFLARNFDTLVYKGLGLDRYPELRNDYFGHYRKLVFLAQTDDDEVTAKAVAAANKLGLEFERRFTGFGGLEQFLNRQANTWLP